MTAVREDGMALGCASNDLRSDKEIVLVAVSQRGYALQFASEGLQDNEAVVTAAVKRHGYALRYASGRWRHDGGLCKLARENRRI